MSLYRRDRISSKQIHPVYKKIVEVFLAECEKDQTHQPTCAA